MPRVFLVEMYVIQCFQVMRKGHMVFTPVARTSLCMHTHTCPLKDNLTDSEVAPSCRFFILHLSTYVHRPLCIQCCNVPASFLYLEVGISIGYIVIPSL